MMALAVLAPIQ